MPDRFPDAFRASEIDPEEADLEEVVRELGRRYKTVAGLAREVGVTKNCIDGYVNRNADLSNELEQRLRDAYQRLEDRDHAGYQALLYSLYLVEKIEEDRRLPTEGTLKEWKVRMRTLSSRLTTIKKTLSTRHLTES